MNQKRRKFEVWSAISIALLLAFLLFFVYPICTLLKQAFTTSESAFTFDNFIKFFSKPYYYNTIFNSFKVSIAVTINDFLKVLFFQALGFPLNIAHIFSNIPRWANTLTVRGNFFVKENSSSISFLIKECRQIPFCIICRPRQIIA